MKSLALALAVAGFLMSGLSGPQSGPQDVSLPGIVRSDDSGSLSASDFGRMIVFSWDASQERLWRQIEVFRAPNVFPTSAVDTSGTFRLSGLARDVHYIFDIGRLPQGWRIRSMTIGAQEVQTEPYLLGAALPQERLDVVLTRLPPSTVSGVVTSGGSAAPSIVIAFPVNERMRTPPWRRLVLFRTGADGEYRLRNLLEGDYYLVALPQSDTTLAAFRDPVRLKDLEKGARRITVTTGSMDAVDIVR